MVYDLWFNFLNQVGQCHTAVVAPGSTGLPDKSLSNTFHRVAHKFAKHELIGLPFSHASDCLELTGSPF